MTLYFYTSHYQMTEENPTGTVYKINIDTSKPIMIYYSYDNGRNWHFSNRNSWGRNILRDFRELSSEEEILLIKQRLK